MRMETVPLQGREGGREAVNTPNKRHILILFYQSISMNGIIEDLNSLWHNNTRTLCVCIHL